MLKFFNKKGKKVMEMKDNGDLTILSEDLKKQGLVVEREEDQDVNKEDKKEDK